MLRRNVEVTQDQFDRAQAQVADLREHHKRTALQIFSETPIEEIREQNVSIDGIFKTLEALQFAIDAGAAQVLGYFGDKAVWNYRVDKALGLV